MGALRNHMPVIGKIGFLIGQIDLNGLQGEAVDGPREKDSAEN